MTRKSVIIVGLVLILIGTILGYVRFSQKMVEKTVEAGIYIDGKMDAITTIKIVGKQKNKLFSVESQYIGTFAIGYCEKSCGDGVEAKIKWVDDETQHISFYDGGSISFFDIKDIEIDKQMDEIVIAFEDGSIVATSETWFSSYSNK